MTSKPAGLPKGMLPLPELEELVDAGAIDTVIVAFTDMQGRLVGKRVSVHYAGWLEPR